MRPLEALPEKDLLFSLDKTSSWKFPWREGKQSHQLPLTPKSRAQVAAGWNPSKVQVYLYGVKVQNTALYLNYLKQALSTSERKF